ncbi:peptide/nickel transport system ATP-binding protein/oligopeptide transport system ATP-binding protein [Melghirimyces profundicolus]|uniref:Peptide/nickel transport system ATP-binding protein/oligopeptide transport system ATP-binding protein n=1 Tax=Melghirimyces profundicolus TaxID=1242148 RepID=A0A2T6C8Q1_9BACL|nr:dipeptide ABC transporter ATP-binding protein [Melghirimyces profundicolus]PTX64695.1 peptide/nickel transport system ATP-binding protein/oligopeptide transport system ATP-binding protein [Melghirimyces profundicolus]
MPEKVLVKLENVKKHYPVRRGWLQRTSARVKAVDGVSLDLYDRETLGVVGESGCGKSTIGRTLIRLEKPTEGKLYFNGTDISELPARAMKPFRSKMQMIFQDPFASLNPRQRVGPALEEPLTIHTSLSKGEKRERVMGLLEEVGLRPDHYDRLPHEFSGGQRQRIGIARALALNPSLIVCDEPVSALDVSVQAQVLKLLRSLQEKHGLTYFFISHDLGVVRHLCDRVLIMYLGQTMELAPVRELYKNPVHPYTEALLSAIPRPVPGRKRERILLRGDLPSPADPPKGCPFHTRCPEAMEICKETRPEWKEIGPGHRVACHAR